MDRQTDHDRWMDGQTDSWVDRQMNRWMTNRKIVYNVRVVVKN